MTDPLQNVRFPPQTIADAEAAAAALPRAIHPTADISVFVVDDARMGRALEFKCSPLPPMNRLNAQRLFNEGAMRWNGPLTVPVEPANADVGRGWDGWVEDLREVAGSIAWFQTEMEALLGLCENWLPNIGGEPPPSAERTEHSFYDLFEFNRREPLLVDRAAYVVPGLAIVGGGHRMGVEPAARRVIGGGSSAKLTGGDGPFVLHHPADADAERWFWHDEQPPDYQIVELDEQRFLDLARACLYLDEPALQPA